MTKRQTTERARVIKVYHILIALLLIVVLFFLLFKYKIKSQLQEKLESVRAAGYPVTLSELDERYTIPILADNGATYFTSAFSCYREPDEEMKKLLPIIGDFELPPRSAPLAEETKSLIAQHLEQNQQALDLIHKAAGMEHSRYPIDFREGWDMLMLHLNGARTAVRLLSLQAILCAEEDNPNQAVESIDLVFCVAHSLSKEPLLISQIVRTACKAEAVRSLERILNRTSLTDAQLTDLSQVLSDSEDLSAMLKGLVGEQCFGINGFNESANSFLEAYYNRGSHPSPKRFGYALAIGLYKAAGLGDMDAIIYLDLMRERINASQLPLHRRQRAFESIDSKCEGISSFRVLLKTMAYAFSSLVSRDLRIIAGLRTAQTAITIQRYRLAKNHLPDTLLDLCPKYLEAVPTDPFDGKPIRYKKLEPGFVVYSIGQDGSDDGGKEISQGVSRSVPHDLTFIIEH